MNAYPPLQMPSVGGRSLRRRQWRQGFLIVLAFLFALFIYWAARPRVAPQPISNLQKNGVHGVYNLHRRNRELLLFNFRVIEDGKLYRCSRFPRNHRGALNGRVGLYPAAFFSDEAFDFLRAHDIRTVVSLDSEQETYALKGYFESLAPQKGFRIRVVNYPVLPEVTYSRDDGEQEGGLRRAMEFINFMKTRDRQGAVLLMGDSGKDAVGVVSAAYELWRNTGRSQPDELWTRVKDRYLVSDVLIKRDKDAAKFSSKAVCKDMKYTFACPETIEAMRTDLERIAQID